jgi:hypothetical protein
VLTYELTLEDLQDERLIAELDALGVHFLWRLAPVDRVDDMDPARLLASLAASREARVCLAIIPLLLHRPDFAAHVPEALDCAPVDARLYLMCHYTAARYLQWKYRYELARLDGAGDLLPDLFSDELGLEAVTDPDDGLVDLAQRHATLSGEAINWLGTYQHAAERWLARLEREWAWAT